MTASLLIPSPFSVSCVVLKTARRCEVNFAQIYIDKVLDALHLNRKHYSSKTLQEKFYTETFSLTRNFYRLALLILVCNADSAMHPQSDWPRLCYKTNRVDPIPYRRMKSFITKKER